MMEVEIRDLIDLGIFAPFGHDQTLEVLAKNRKLKGKCTE
jgi:hypothetical protein